MKLKTKVCALSLALTLGCSILAACGGKKQPGGDSTSIPDASTSQPADSTSQPAASTSQPAASTSQPAASTSQPAASTSNPPSTTSEPPVVKYLVALPTSSDYSITGINTEGYAQGEKVSFRVVLSNNEKEIVSVGYDTTTLTAKQDGSYEFNMPGKNVLLFVNTKDVEHYALSHSGNVQVDGDPVTFILKLGTDPVSDDFTLEAVSGGEHISINGEQVTGVSEGEVVLAAKINGQEVARETFTVAASAYKTFRQAIDDAWTNADFANNAKSTKSANKYKMRAKVVFMGSVYNSKVEMLLDDGTAIIDYQVSSSTDITAFQVGDVIEIEEQIQNYYGLIEAMSSDVKYAKKVEGVTINTTPFVDALTGAAYDEVYNNNMVNNGEHKIVPVNLSAKAKVVGDKNRYEVQGATKGLLATTKSVINLAFVEGATYNFKGYLLNWNSSNTAQYCNYVAIEQTKLAANSVTLNQKELTMAVSGANATKQLTYTTDPVGAGQSVEWSVAPEGVVTVDQDGKVDAVAAGNAVITLTVDGKTDTCNVTVLDKIEPATAVSLDKESLSLLKGGEDTLEATVTPADSSDNPVWSAEPNDVVSLTADELNPAKVTVKALKAGNATVTVRYNDTVSASCTVAVRDQKIADLAHAKKGDAVDTYGIIAGTYPVAGRQGIWIADGDSYLTINMAPTSEMTVGKILHVVGTIDAYNGAKQVKNDATLEVVESYAGLATPTTLNLTEEALQALTEADQARYATITGVVKAHDGSGSSAHHTITLTVGSTDTKVYVHKDNCGATVTGAFDAASVGKTVTINGYVSARNTSTEGKNVFDKNTLEHYQLINPTLENVVTVDCTGIALNETSVEVAQGATLPLTVSAQPAGADLPGEVTWSVLNNDKVTVSNAGVVSVASDAVVGSTATVKATCGGFEATCTITVKAPSATVSDVLNRATTGSTGSSYADWSGKTGDSGAIYAGNSAGGNESIQLRSKNSNSGIVSTTSGGKVAKVIIEWNSNTAAGRTLNVYGSNTAYEAASDLYDNSKQGTLLGTIVYGTSTELTITGDYAYIGLRSNDGAMYITSVTIVWANA